MNCVISAVLTASALIFGVFLPREEAGAQTVKGLVGMWTLVSVTLEQDGNKIDMYGANPQGQAVATSLSGNSWGTSPFPLSKQ